MGSDRARVSYNPKQQYRSVVMQQGRVTLEADWNESQLIASEAARLEALDIVGPAGTPDNGYAISLTPGSSDFNIGAGIMYVGGMRAWLPAALPYSQQPQQDWRDASNDASWVPVPSTAPTGNEYVYLALREQEVSAVEDSDLKEIALGGPDTAQRTRLVQHVVRLATTGTDCATGLAAAQTSWAAEGFTLNNDDSVSSFAQLQVAFVPASTPASACDPTAQSGYLGADNQLIRVQVSDPKAAPQCLLWGYDDASFLYAVTVTSATSVTLQSAPVDAEHIPQAGQVVEVLMAGALLSNGAYAAAPTGEIFLLGASAYNPDSKILTLPSSLNVSLYGDGTSTHPSPAQVFLRIWAGTLPLVPGAYQTLTGTGVQVNLTSSNKNNVFRGGDYWMFAVRPALPTVVYPERYASGPQPPDGPRMWICPLAVIGWSGNIGSILSDCRLTFGPLASKALHITDFNWPNDDLVSLPAFRNNPLQVSFDFSPVAQSVSDATMTLAVEVPYAQPQYFGFYGEEFNAVHLTASPVAGTRAKLLTNITIPKLGSGIVARNPGLFGVFRPTNLPNNLLANYDSLIKTVAASTLPSSPATMLGYDALIQPGNAALVSGAATWTRQLSADDFISYLSTVSWSTIGPALRARITMKGRDIWSGKTNSLAYLDGQAFGQPGLRADGTTPCTELILPSGEDARASDFESWFWLSLFVWSETDYTVGDLPLSATVADFNKDNAKDIAVATLSGGIFVWQNNGNGGFTLNGPYQASEWPLSIVAADFNGDGFMDLAVPSYTNGTITILLGSASGAFTVSSPIKVGNGPWALVAADFNGDGIADLAVTNAQDNSVSILIGAGDGTFTLTKSSPITVGTIPLGLVATDLNSDGFIDLAVLCAGSNSVSLLTGDGTGNFVAAAVPTLTLPSDGSDGAGNAYPALPLSITTADFNHDGLADLAIGGIYQGASGSSSTSYVATFMNNVSNGTFNTVADFQVPVFGIPGSLAAANLDPTNPANNIDLIVTGASFVGGTGTFSVLMGKGDGTFQNSVVYPVSGSANPTAVVASDFNGDGIADLAMATSAGNLSVFLNEQSQISSAVVITGVTPSGAVHPGDQIQLQGKNFGVPGLNSISIAGVPVTVFNAALSSNTVLAITVPPIQGISALGQNATLYLSNPVGSAIWSLQLMQAQPTTPTGQLAVAESQVSPTSAVAAGSIFVTFTVSGNTTLSDIYTVAPTVDAGWSAALVVGQNNPALIVPSQIAIAAANAPQMVNTSFVVMVTVPEGSAVGTTGNLNVAITSQSNAKNLFATTPQPYALTVGSLPGGSQNAVIISLSSIQAPGSTPDGKTLTIPLNANPPVIAIFNFQVNQADIYNVTAPTFANPAGWSAAIQSGGSFSGPPNPQPMFVQLSAAGASGDTPAASATTMTITVVGTKTGATGQAVFTVQPQ